MRKKKVAKKTTQRDLAVPKLGGLKLLVDAEINKVPDAPGVLLLCKWDLVSASAVFLDGVHSLRVALAAHRKRGDLRATHFRVAETETYCHACHGAGQLLETQKPLFGPGYRQAPADRAFDAIVAYVQSETERHDPDGEGESPWHRQQREEGRTEAIAAMVALIDDLVPSAKG